ncbi:MAG: ArsA family ATPase [Actinobacteria bacterium]|nr:ArsA family ATPase [Actinomycetota bacterium]MCA1719592.1 ArsA family ATPase [Actinomycetota bacterium]
MRVLLFTGKGGVGKTTASAATAALAASRGRKTLVISTDPAHSLADALGVPLGPEPTEVDTGLYAMQVDAQRAFERTWRDVQSYLLVVLERAGVDALQAEELTVLPGAEEVLALLEVRKQVQSGLWDLVVVDCAPTGETLRLLALPEALNWYVEKVFPAQRRALRAVRPLLSRVAGPAVPADGVFDAVEKLHRELGEVRRVLTSPETSVRLVLTPEAVVVAEARRTLTSLALYGYRVDGLVANRVFPSGDSWRDGWVAAQSAQLESVRADVAPLPVLESPYLPSEPVGLDALTALGLQLYAEGDPAAETSGAELLDLERTSDGFVLSLSLPLARRSDVDLARSGDELVVTVGGHRRVLALPSALRRCVVAGAVLTGGRLAIRFEPDPDLWMRT